MRVRIQKGDPVPDRSGVVFDARRQIEIQTLSKSSILVFFT